MLESFLLAFDSMQIHLLAKTASFLAAGSVLLFVGYAAGLSIQHQREIRFRCYSQLYQLIPSHKEHSLGDYDRAYELQQIEWKIGMCVHDTHFTTSWDELPRLLKGGALASDEWNTDWRDKAVASAVGFHRDRPDILLPPEVKQELESFVARDADVRGSISFYARHQSPH